LNAVDDAEGRVARDGGRTSAGGYGMLCNGATFGSGSISVLRRTRLLLRSVVRLREYSSNSINVAMATRPATAPPTIAPVGILQYGMDQRLPYPGTLMITYDLPAREPLEDEVAEIVTGVDVGTMSFITA
jgi:hypothetical protein